MDHIVHQVLRFDASARRPTPKRCLSVNLPQSKTKRNKRPTDLTPASGFRPAFEALVQVGLVLAAWLCAFAAASFLSAQFRLFAAAFEAFVSGAPLLCKQLASAAP